MITNWMKKVKLGKPNPSLETKKELLFIDKAIICTEFAPDVFAHMR